MAPRVGEYQPGAQGKPTFEYRLRVVKGPARHLFDGALK